MKRIIYTALLGLLGSMISVQAQEGHLTKIRITGDTIQKKGRTVYLGISLDLSELKVSNQRSVRLTPVVVHNDAKKELALAPIVIDGRTRARIHERQKALNGSAATDDAYVVYRTGKQLPQQVTYQTSLPYEPWMTQSRLVLREEVTGCLECPEGNEEALVNNSFVEMYRPNYITPFVQPKKEEIKVRDVTRDARLQFHWDSYKIEPDFKNNRQELDKVRESIELVKQDPNLTITGIYITGYASPEGKAIYNQQLSADRAHALAKYAQKDTQVSKELWHVTGAGEDWIGLRAELEKHPELIDYKKALQIFDECKNEPDTCEKRIRFLVPLGKKRQMLMDEVYGPLRRNEYRIEYHVRGFNLEEARQVIHSRPELLSVEEIYMVASSYPEGSTERKEAFLIAARTYPANAAAVVNAACLLLEEGKQEEAIQLMEKSAASEAPAVQNVLGVALIHEKHYERALQVLKKAAQAGNMDAEHNCEELKKVMSYQ